MKKCYGDRIERLSNLDKEEFWRLLDIIVEFHDLGKVFTPFQNAIKLKVGEKELSTEFKYDDGPHNYLSPVFLDCRLLGIERELVDVIIQSIGFHHERAREIDSDFENKIDI